jgi:S-adenosylmethionine hydrolase
MIITLTTDFGEIYQAEMKGVILKINPRVRIVSISHSIPRHNIIAGAFALFCAARYFPLNTIHIGVVDPEVGTVRRGIVIKSASGQYLIGPDNGLLIPAARSLGSFMVYEIPAVEGASPTFHGRDIFAPLAARISKGYDVKKFKLLQEYEEIDFGKPRVASNAMEGKIIYIDEFGNAITNIPSEIVKLKLGEKLKFKEKLIPYVRTYADVEEGKPLLLVGSHGFLEIAAYKASASSLFKLKAGDRVSLIKT